MAANCSIILIQAFGSGSMFPVISWKKAIVHPQAVVPGFLIHFQILTSSCFLGSCPMTREMFSTEF